MTILPIPPMSTPETTPLNPAAVNEATDPELDPSNDESYDILVMTTLRKRRDPLHILILYGLSFVVSMGGLGAALWDYGITITAPFDEDHKEDHKAGYEEVFFGMQSVVVLVGLFSNPTSI
jgi:hypothetical protein